MINIDEKLVKKAIKSNFSVYSVLVNSLKSDEYKIAYTILKNEQDSIDAYLQAVEKGLKNIKNLKEPKYFKTWFLKIVINEARNIISRNNKIISLEKIEKKYEDNLYKKEEKLDLEKCLEYIDPQVREMIKLKYYMGYKLEEIANMLDDKMIVKGLDYKQMEFWSIQ